MRIVLLLLTMCLVMCHGAVVDLTPEQYLEAASSDTFWLVQFGMPWDPKTKAWRPVLEELSEALQGIVSVGFLPVNSRDALAIADLSVISSFPQIQIINHRLSRVEVPHGVGMYGLPVSHPTAYSGQSPNLAQLKAWVLKNAPTRYADPASMRLVRNVIDVEHAPAVAAAASSSAKTFVVFVSDAMTTEIAASQNAAAAALRNPSFAFQRVRDVAAFDGVTIDSSSNVVVLDTTQKSPVIVAQWQQVWSDVDGLKQKLTEVLPKAAQSHDEHAREHHTHRRVSVRKFVTEGAFRELTSREAYDDHVVNTVGALSAVAFLGPSQDEHARALSTLERISSDYLGNSEMRVDFYWINAERHKMVAKHVGASRVPSMAFFLPINKDGKKAVRWLEGPFEYSRMKKFMADRMLKPDGGMSEYKPASATLELFASVTEIKFPLIEYVHATDDSEETLDGGAAKAKKTSAKTKNKKGDDEEEDASPKKKKREPTKREIERDEAIKKEMAEKKAAKERRIKEKAEREAKERAQKAAENKKKLEKQQKAGGGSSSAAKNKKKTDSKKKSASKKKAAPKQEKKKQQEKPPKQQQQQEKKKPTAQTEDPKKTAKKKTAQELRAEKKAQEEQRRKEAEAFAEQDGEYVHIDEM